MQYLTRIATHFVTGICVCLLMAVDIHGQKLANRVPPIGPTLGPAEVSYWEFGMEFRSNGDSKGIVASIPVPIDWPEQKVQLIKKIQSDNVRKISFNDLTRSMKQLVIKANRLRNGESARASVVLRIEKSDIVAPAEPEKLRFADPVPSAIRAYLRPSPYIESNHKRIRDIAGQKIQATDDATDYEIVEQIYRWVRDNVQYEFDEVIHTCLEALDSGKGDCEELSSLFIAICRARGIPARAVWIPGHTYPEFYLQDEQGIGHWIPCQAAGDYQFGSMYDSSPILQKGDRFKLPGQRKPLRYVQPILTAKDSTGGLTPGWIMRQLTEQQVAAMQNDD